MSSDRICKLLCLEPSLQKKRSGVPLKTRATTLNEQEGELSVEDPETCSASFPPFLCLQSQIKLPGSLSCCAIEV